jgi:hypothetical protein
MNAATGLFAARVLAWSLLLAGWLGLTHLAERYAAGPLQAFALVAVWLLVLGAGASAVARWRAGRWPLRAAMLGAALAASLGTLAATQGGGFHALWPAAPAWALLVALASTTVRGWRHAMPRRPAAPLLPAATGALIVWVVAGDPVESAALALRLAAMLVGAALLLAWLQPRSPWPESRRGCRAGLFDCSLPAWPAQGWQQPAHWPLMVASLAMLPMMAALPQMLALCGDDGGLGAAGLAPHLLAMFAPALLWPQRARRSLLPALCAALLLAGGIALLGRGASVLPWTMLAHAAAWSLAWRAQLDQGALRAAPRQPPWRSALAHAAAALLLGAAVAHAGAEALHGVHLLLAGAGTLAAAAWLGAACVGRVPDLRARSRCR